MVTCPFCGFNIKFCGSCGYPLEEAFRESKPKNLEELLTCPSCGETTKTCPKCGHVFLPLTREELLIKKEVPSSSLQYEKTPTIEMKKALDFSNILSKKIPIKSDIEKKVETIFQGKEVIKEKIDSKKIENLEKRIEKKEPVISKVDVLTEEAKKTKNIVFCSFHPSIPAVAKCDICKKDICEECKKTYGEYTLCPDDYAEISKSIKEIKVIEKEKGKEKIVIDFIISLIAGLTFLLSTILNILIINHKILFSPLTIIENISLLFEGLCGIIILICSLLVYFFNKRIAGGILVTFLSLIGLVKGWGFLIGSALGVVGGITSLIERK
jgi:hypothetical protein